MELQARADRLAQLIEERLDVRGHGLKAKLRRAGRLLPKHVRRDAGLLVTALELRDQPRLARQTDEAALARAYREAERYLLNLNAWDRRRAVALNWLAGLSFSLLVILALVLAVLVWRGLL